MIASSLGNTQHPLLMMIFTTIAGQRSGLPDEGLCLLLTKASSGTRRRLSPTPPLHSEHYFNCQRTRTAICKQQPFDRTTTMLFVTIAVCGAHGQPVTGPDVL
jgi:hypothetical protein